MIKLLQYLENRALGLHPQTNDPLIQGINASEQQLILACQSTDRLAALRVFCQNHPYGHLESEHGYCLIDYILPAPLSRDFLWSTGTWLKIASAGNLGDLWDTHSEVYVNIETGQTYDTSQEKICADMPAYLNHRRACWKEYLSATMKAPSFSCIE